MVELQFRPFFEDKDQIEELNQNTKDIVTTDIWDLKINQDGDYFNASLSVTTTLCKRQCHRVQLCMT